MNIIIFIIILLILVLSHEFGHFIVAKKSGIRVDEFAFGFPPKLFGIKRGETEYNFNALPIGGYVKIFGENPDDESISGTDSRRSFVNKPWYIKAAVLSAGVIMNFLVAWLLISIGYISGLPSSTSGIPKGAIVENQILTITGVISDSPAEKVSLKVGDKIISLKNQTETLTNLTPDDLKNFVVNNGSENMEIGIIRGTAEETIDIMPTVNPQGVPMIGISMDVIGKVSLPIHKSIWEGFKLTWDLSVATTQGFYNLIKGAFTGESNLASVTGPIGIIGIVGDAAEFGFIYLLSFTALISINLAIINLIPFPALDGGRLLFLLIEKIKGSPIKPKIANIMNSVGFALLMILMVVVTFHDIIKLF
jgi:regulator of sigma E protease